MHRGASSYGPYIDLKRRSIRSYKPDQRQNSYQTLVELLDIWWLTAFSTSFPRSNSKKHETNSRKYVRPYRSLKQKFQGLFAKHIHLPQGFLDWLKVSTFIDGIHDVETQQPLQLANKLEHSSFRALKFEVPKKYLPPQKETQQMLEF